MESQYMAQNKVVAFLDIIGFSNLVSERITDREFIRKLDFTLKFGRNILEDSLRLTTDINARMFSDCICASSAANNVLDVMNFIYSIEALQSHLALSGIFICGGLTLGLHCETPRMIFSKGLIDAYDLERKAVFPRILISGDLKRYIEENRDEVQEIKHDLWRGLSKSIDSHFREDEDGKNFLNYLTVLLLMDHAGTRRQFADSHKIAIQRWVDESRRSVTGDNERRKHEWAAKYHNRICKEIFPGESSLLIGEI